MEATFVVQPLPGWSNNLSMRFVKSPKIHLLDSGLAAHLRGDRDASALAQSPNLGPLLETFVVQQVRKLLAWSRHDATPYHFRAELWRQYGIARLSLFGSASRNQLRPDSDVNLMVDFLPGGGVLRVDVAFMQNAFSAAFGGRKVGIATPEILGSWRHRDSIVPDLKVIYEAPEALVIGA